MGRNFKILNSKLDLKLKKITYFMQNFSFFENIMPFFKKNKCFYGKKVAKCPFFFQMYPF